MSLEPAKKSFTIQKGGTFRARLLLLQGNESSSAQDLSGYTGRCHLYDPSTYGTLLDLTTANGGLIITGNLGAIDLFIDDAVTDALAWRSASYKLSITQSSGDTDILLYGAFRVKGF